MSKLLFPLCTLLGGLLLSGTVSAQTCTNANMPESTPTSRYTFHAQGTVTDNITGLMWKRCLGWQTWSNNGTPDNYVDDQCRGETGAETWYGALRRAQTANAANESGYNNWRVPNLKELKSIVEYCRANPAINTEVFPGALPFFVWSSSPMPSFPEDNIIWFVNFLDGNSNVFFGDSSFHVRLVRSGQ